MIYDHTTIYIEDFETFNCYKLDDIWVVSFSFKSKSNQICTINDRSNKNSLTELILECHLIFSNIIYKHKKLCKECHGRGTSFRKIPIQPMSSGVYNPAFYQGISTCPTTSTTQVFTPGIVYGSPFTVPSVTINTPYVGAVSPIPVYAPPPTFKEPTNEICNECGGRGFTD